MEKVTLRIAITGSPEAVASIMASLNTLGEASVSLTAKEAGDGVGPAPKTRSFGKQQKAALMLLEGETAPLSTGEIASRLAIASSAASSLLKNLAGKGLVNATSRGKWQAAKAAADTEAAVAAVATLEVTDEDAVAVAPVAVAPVEADPVGEAVDMP